MIPLEECLRAYDLSQQGYNFKEISLEMGIGINRARHIVRRYKNNLDGANTKKVRCKVNTVCKHKTAVYWYWTNGEGPILTTMTIKKPTRTAVPCCEDCATVIWKRQSEAL